MYVFVTSKLSPMVHTKNVWCFAENSFDCCENTELFPIREMVNELTEIPTLMISAACSL